MGGGEGGGRFHNVGGLFVLTSEKFLREPMDSRFPKLLNRYILFINCARCPVSCTLYFYYFVPTSFHDNVHISLPLHNNLSILTTIKAIVAFCRSKQSNMMSLYAIL